jgi:peptidyl-prolyl cis-trans isomerase A (cyclophilin A)
MSNENPSSNEVAVISTTYGDMTLSFWPDVAPKTVENFKKLAREGFYDGTAFHRIIKGFMIQGGDPKGDGSGEPGYVIKDEKWDGAKHDRAGLLCMANRGPNTNGAQFFITDARADHLDSGYTIFGECAPVEIVHEIASVPKGAMDRPTTPVTIKTVTITRDEKKK